RDRLFIDGDEPGLCLFLQVLGRLGFIGWCWRRRLESRYKTDGQDSGDDCKSPSKHWRHLREEGISIRADLTRCGDKPQEARRTLASAFSRAIITFRPPSNPPGVNQPCPNA